jgi:hypothetical protein
MQAVAIGTDEHATQMVRARADGCAQPTTERPRAAHRLGTLRR